MSHYSRAEVAVKAAPRTQRKPMLRLPEAMLEKQAREFPESFERYSVLAIFALRTLAQRINDYTNDVLAPLGLNAAKYNYLMVLYVSPEGGMTPSELSRFIHTSNATVTAMLAVLERDGFVRRRAHRTDGRSSILTLTAKGKRIVERAAPLHHGHWASALSDLSIAERAQLTDLLLRAGEGFDKHFTDGA